MLYPNNVPRVQERSGRSERAEQCSELPGHGGQDGLLAEGYVAKISMLILATYPEAALNVTIRSQNQN